MTTAGNEEFNL